MVRIKILGTAYMQFTEPCYLESFDLEDADGTGRAVLTVAPNNAMTFADAWSALGVYRMQSNTRPLRLDGKANRPLTAFTVEFEHVPETAPGTMH